MGFLDYYSSAYPNHKSIRGNGITTFLLHVAQCIIFNLTNHVKTIIIANVSLKTFYSRLGFKVFLKILWLLIILNRLAANLIMRKENLKHIRKNIGLQCLHTIQQRVTFIHDDRINFNINKNVFIDLDVDPTS